jgi:hypothetical protein
VIPFSQGKAESNNDQLSSPLQVLNLDILPLRSFRRLRSSSECILKYQIRCCCDATGMLSSKSSVYGSTLTMHMVTSMHKIMHSSTSTRPPRRNFLSHQQGLNTFRLYELPEIYASLSVKTELDRMAQGGDVRRLIPSASADSHAVDLRSRKQQLHQHRRLNLSQQTEVFEHQELLHTNYPKSAS